MKYVIQYTDGAYEYKVGSGFPCTLIEEAMRFDSVEDAKYHAENLEDVMIIEVEE